MKKQNIDKNNKELNLVCPKYLDYLQECPSSKNVVSNSDIEQISKLCASDKYTKCNIYCKQNEKAA